MEFRWGVPLELDQARFPVELRGLDAPTVSIEDRSRGESCAADIREWMGARLGEEVRLFSGGRSGAK